MSDFETVARPYSRAVFELAMESKSSKKALQSWSDVLQIASQIVLDESMQALILSPSVTRAQLLEMFLSVMTSVEGAPEISQDVKNLLAILATNNRLSALPAIVVEYEKLKQASEGTIEVKVVSARNLTAKQEKEMTGQLKKRLGKDVSITAEIDQSLIAGAIIKAGDLVIDGSALGRLSKLATLLNK
ncbi:MAG: F0F1 ATP synthase subunit delta [Gammaproteobacteria bacterium]|nr:F0F1 ATP synthase subunit delta [Gammaproteobacteria bacterium]MBL6998621.1 F0F1 ATP synthase subunit delta [Gammaproteobacteria bacterium]